MENFYISSERRISWQEKVEMNIKIIPLNNVQEEICDLL